MQLLLIGPDLNQFFSDLGTEVIVASSIPVWLEDVLLLSSLLNPLLSITKLLEIPNVFVQRMQELSLISWDKGFQNGQFAEFGLKPFTVHQLHSDGWNFQSL